MAEFPGVFCQKNNLSTDLLADSSNLPPIDFISNGLVLELRNFCDKTGRTCDDLFQIICKLNANFCSGNSKAVYIKITRLVDIKKKLGNKKKVQGVKNVTELLVKEFSPPSVCNVGGKKVTTENVQGKILNKSDRVYDKNIVSTSEINSVATQTVCENDTDTELKDLNLLKYSHKVLERKCNKLQSDIKNKSDLIHALDNRIGHYSTRNVNKRDETAKKNLHTLRNEQRTVCKQEKLLKKCTEEIASSKISLQNLTSKNNLLTTELESLKQQLKIEKQKKLNSQKSNSYLRNELEKVKKTSTEENTNREIDLLEIVEQHEDSIKTLRLQLLDSYEEVKKLQYENEQKEIIMSWNSTKSDSKSFNDNVRMCIMELAGLEVAIEKVSPIIQCVSFHLFGKELVKSDLPSPHTVQRIIDEGHFLAKSFIAEKIDSCQNWGLSRDGTSRKKKKILDTSVTIDTGDVMSLGFNRVNRETGAAINDITKQHINELDNLHRNLHSAEETNSFVARSLEKLSFTMSDRASNEKKADVLLDEWRDSVLGHTDAKEVVHHFHCMAHTLLAFHSYTSPGMKELQKELEPLGRDAIPFFKCWSKKESVVERTARTVSDVFGPAGDHHGIRDRWDAYCAERGIKSCIENYKDNRFNSVFATSAQVLLHRKDFINVIETVEKPNMLLQSVKADLSSDIICTLLKCYGIFYIKVTGPYWNLMTSGKVHYLELSPHILELKSFLENCITNPDHILYFDTHWSSTDPLDIRLIPHIENYKKALCHFNSCKDLQNRVIVAIAKAMISVIDRQLVDFLEGGTYFGIASEKEVKRTDFAMVTNLSCEHHFGDLDSSQKRRPNASLHHHSSVQLLKRNRSKMFKWLNEMNSEERSVHLKAARKGGQNLRIQHMANEKEVLLQISNEMMSTTKKQKGAKLQNQRQKKRKNDDQSLCEGEITVNFPTHDFVENEYVVIAYQDGWYPGIVEEIKTKETAVVKFMSPCRKDGQFQWPRRDDRQLVHCKFILEQNLIPDCMNSGRQWLFRNFEKLEEKYQTFQELYF